LIEAGVAFDHDFELAGAELAHAARTLSPERDHQRLARDSESVGYREDALDLCQPNRLKQRCPLRAHQTPLYIRRGSPKLNSRGGRVAPAEDDVFGTIKKVIKDKGFGFITPDDGTDEVFFHRSRLSPKVYFEDLREGDQVQFEVRPGDKGPQAFNLRLR
jgi:CspA family cold shock protein